MSGLARYRLTIEPWLSEATRRRDCRILQDKNAIEIVEAVFAQYPRARFDVRVSGQVAAALPKYAITTQYRELDLDFVLREKSQSSTIASTLKEARKTAAGQVIDLPPEHEALPHDGLGHTWSSFLGKGAAEEGTIDYALWRKAGGRALPSAADTPKGLPTEMRVFKPKS